MVLNKENVNVFRIASLQMSSRNLKVGDTEVEYRKARDENMNACLRIMDRALPPPRIFAPGYGGRTKLVVFPEAAITGYPMGQDAKEWVNRGCIYIPGEETEKLGEKAQEHGVYIACNSYERIDDWPNAYFNTCFIMDSKGKVLIKYRRIHTDVCVSPDEIYDDFVKKYGWEALFPVAETNIGTIATLACGEINFPEIARMFALRGAEILCHCDGSGKPDPMLVAGSSPIALAWSINRRARAIENICYLAQANQGMFGGGSEIIDYYGRTLARTLDRGNQVVSTFVNMQSLRLRRVVEFPVFIPRLRSHLFAQGYEKYTFWPPNQFLKKIPENIPLAKGEFKKIAFENCVKLGVIKPDVAKESYFVPKGAG
jgi:predicted amidohydrolase